MAPVSYTRGKTKYVQRDILPPGQTTVEAVMAISSYRKLNARYEL